MPQHTFSTCSLSLPPEAHVLVTNPDENARRPNDEARWPSLRWSRYDPSDVHGPGLRGRARRLPSSEVCAGHAGSNHDQPPVLTGHDNGSGPAARLWRALKPVQSIDKAFTPGIAVVRDSLGIDDCSRAE